MLACSRGHKDVVKLLLDHLDPRIDLNVRSGMIACMDGHKDVVKLLLDSPERIEMNKKYCINMGLPT